MLNTTFRSLHVRNYRYFATGQLIKLVGVWMMFTAQDWLVLDLSGNSPGALGIVTALQFVPVLLLTLYAGTLADRYDKRKLLIVANIGYAVSAVVFAVVVATGTVTLWWVYVFALIFGLANAIETPVRQSFVSELVELPLLPNALALSAATFNTARIAGPALAGVALAVLDTARATPARAGVALAVLDTGPVFLVATVLSIAPAICIWLIRPGDLYRELKTGGKSEARVIDGLRYTRRRSDLMMPIVLMFVVGMIGFNFPVTLAALAKIEFGAGPSTFGLLTTALAVGALGGALAGSGRRARPGPYVVLGAAVAFSAFEIAVGFAPTFLVALVLLVPTGFFMIYLAQGANHRVQMGVDGAFRGRVMALYVLVFLGTTPIGATVAGWWGERYGVPFSIWMAGVVCLVASLVGLGWQLRSGGDRLAFRWKPWPRIVIVPPASEADQPAATSAPVPATLPRSMVSAARAGEARAGGQFVGAHRGGH